MSDAGMRSAPLVLFVDDEPEMAWCLRTILERQGGAKVMAVFTAEEALSELLARRYDLVILDCMLPHVVTEGLPQALRSHYPGEDVRGYEGIRLLHFLRHAPPSLRWATDVESVPIIVWTAAAHELRDDVGDQAILLHKLVGFEEMAEIVRLELGSIP